MNQEEIIIQKLKLLYSALSRKDRWFTGLSIKKYINKKIFALSEGFDNQSITAGRWSAYCHYSIFKSFSNMLDKNHITSKSRVLVHPLLPNFLIDEVLSRTNNVFSLDISKSDFNFELDKYQNSIDNEAIDLVIHYNFCGLYEELKENINYSQSKGIASLVVINNFDINLSLIDLFENLKLGGFIWSFGDSFWDDQLNIVMKHKLPTKNWYLSWQIETRTRSVLEYHLRESQDIYLPIIEAYFYLLLEEYKKQKFVGNLYQLFSRFILVNKFNNPNEARKLMEANYPNIFDSALPDIVFDLQVLTPVKFRDYGKPKHLIHQASSLQNQAKSFYNFFLTAINSRPQGSLEIPDFYLDKTYLKYIFYTTELDFWKNLLIQKGFYVNHPGELHPYFIAIEELVNAKHITQYGLIIDVPRSLLKDLPKLIKY